MRLGESESSESSVDAGGTKNSSINAAQRPALKEGPTGRNAVGLYVLPNHKVRGKDSEEGGREKRVVKKHYKIAPHGYHRSLTRFGRSVTAALSQLQFGN